MYRLFLGRTGAAAESHSGTGSLSLTASLAASGRKAGRGSGSHALTATLAGSGRGQWAGAGVIAAEATLGQSGVKRALGQAPDWLYAEDGTTRLTDENGVPLWSDGSGLPIALAASLDQAGTRDGSGTGAITAVAVLAGTGLLAAAGAGSVTAEVSPAAAGTRAGLGAGAIVAAAELSATGEAAEGDEHSGTGTLVLGAFMHASGKKATGSSGSLTATTSLSGRGRKEVVEEHIPATLRAYRPRRRIAKSGTGSLVLSPQLEADGRRRTAGRSSLDMMIVPRGQGEKTWESDDELAMVLAA